MKSSYTLLDFGNGKRLEEWGPYRLVRPDPTAMGKPVKPDEWKNIDATYEGEKGKGNWKKNNAIPEEWITEFDDVKMMTRLAPYKHTGVFPEQQQNWVWSRAQAKKMKKPITVLHLFAYTGGATMALARDGHFVTHVDASKPAIEWAKENQALNNLASDSIRWILEDAPLFVSRELKRGKRYDAIILDPPAFGHSPTGKTWRVECDLKPLLENCAMLLTDQPAFLVLNGYAQHDTAESYHRLMSGILRSKTSQENIRVESKELLLHAANGYALSTGVTARCSF